MTSTREAVMRSTDASRVTAAASEPLGQHIDLHRAAELLDVSYRTLHRLCAAGQLPHMRIGRVIRVAVADLHRLRVDGPAGDTTAPSDPLGGHRPPRARTPRGRYARLARGIDE